jgi:dihydroxy-acid dehydratase
LTTITISDGISMGTEGMKYSLVSREIIADSIEAVVGCEGFDGLVAIGGCDKNMPGCVMAMARLNRPAVFVYGGTILPGCISGILAGERLKKDRAAALAERKPDIVSCFEAVGAYANGQIGDTADRHAQAVEDMAASAWNRMQATGRGSP